MSKPENLPRMGICRSCKEIFQRVGITQCVCSVCKTITKQCQQCKAVFSFQTVGKVNNDKRLFCGHRCAATWRNAQPGVIDRFNRTIGPHRIGPRPKSPATSLRMKANNPMHNPETVMKVKASMQGKTFLSRGGNSKITPEQQTLADILNLPMEHVIATRLARGHFPCLPNSYKVDLASPEHLLAIEVDGNTHKLKKWKFLDQRKTEILNFLGWKVLRFWNEDIRANPQLVAATIRLAMASK